MPNTRVGSNKEPWTTSLGTLSHPAETPRAIGELDDAFDDLGVLIIVCTVHVVRSRKDDDATE